MQDGDKMMEANENNILKFQCRYREQSFLRARVNIRMY